jgi:hypothetical protein
VNATIEDFLRKPEPQPAAWTLVPAQDDWQQLHRSTLPALDAPGQRFEDYVQAVADQLDPWCCYTDRIARLEGRDLAEVAALENELRALWADYSQFQVHEQEVTLESVVLHRTLKRAFNAWLLALTQARQGSWEPALELADQATRLMLAVARTQEQLTQRTGLLGLDLREE